MKLVELEGTHTIQNVYSSLDVHVGQSYSVLIMTNQPAKDYYIVVSSRFTLKVLTTTSVLHYSNSVGPVSGPIPSAPAPLISWSLRQARAIRTNLTASRPRPNPQGSYHYGMVKVTREGKRKQFEKQIKIKPYAVNNASFYPADTPLKLADYFKIDGVYKPGSISDQPTNRPIFPVTSVLQVDYRAFVEIVFENWEDILESWHFNGYSSFVVGMELGKWGPASRKVYNLNDAVSRCTVHVYPRSWTAIYVALENVGMWNMRSKLWERQYLGQQLYMRVYTTSTSLRSDEYQISKNALLCGKASGRHKGLL